MSAPGADPTAQDRADGAGLRRSEPRTGGWSSAPTLQTISSTDQRQRLPEARVSGVRWERQPCGVVDDPAPTDDDLIAVARSRFEHADAPSSRFELGAALATIDGSVVAGAVVESVSLGPAICPERVVPFASSATGKRPERLALAALKTAGAVTWPCGTCSAGCLGIGWTGARGRRRRRSWRPRRHGRRTPPAGPEGRVTSRRASPAQKNVPQNGADGTANNRSAISVAAGTVTSTSPSAATVPQERPPR